MEKRKVSIDIAKANFFAIALLIGAAIVFGIPFLMIWGKTQPHWPDQLSMSSNPWSLLWVLLAYLLGIVIHELIHGITWSFFAPNGWRSISFGVIWKMVKIMTVDKEEIIEYKKENVDGREVDDPAKRGNILSDNGELMSTSLPEYNVTFDFIPGAPRLKAKDKERNPQKYLKDSLEREKYIAKKDSIFRANVDSISIGVAELCPEMGGPDSIKAHMLRGLEKRSQDYDMFKHHAFDYISYQKLRQLPIFRIKEQYKSGVIPTARNHREKPFGDLASRTIGDLYARKDSAEAGIELAFDSVLRGVPGKKRTSLIRSKSNFVDQPIEPPVDGLDVVTTINVTMQDICESALREKLIEVNADFGVCILMDVHTGDIKALVNLRRRADGTYNDDQNLAVSALMEPGSTFKTASILVALDDGEITINDQIEVSAVSSTTITTTTRSALLTA